MGSCGQGLPIGTLSAEASTHRDQRPARLATWRSTMKRHVLPLAIGAWFAMIVSASFARGDTPRRAVATSPDRQIRIEVSLADRGEGLASPVYSVSFRGKPVILPSRLGIELAGGRAWATTRRSRASRRGSINETYTQHPGKRSRVVNHCEEVVVTLRERAAPAWRWEIVLRAYDDGVAFRYRFPAQEGWRWPRDRRRADPDPDCPATPWLTPCP